MEKVINNVAGMDVAAKEILATLLVVTKDKHPTRATVLGLSGELGAGKTAFTKSFARALGVSESVSSPTFVLARFYDVPGDTSFRRLVHMDAYRIESLDELRPLGWQALLADPQNLILVEWPEKLRDQFPDGSPFLTFRIIDEHTRGISVKI